MSIDPTVCALQAILEMLSKTGALNIAVARAGLEAAREAVQKHGQAETLDALLRALEHRQTAGTAPMAIRRSVKERLDGRIVVRDWTDPDDPNRG